MTVTEHFSDNRIYAAVNERLSHKPLHDRINELESRIDELEEMLGLRSPSHFDRGLDLSPTQERFLNLLLATERLTYQAAIIGLYGSRPLETRPGKSMLWVLTSSLRKKLKPAGIDIRTIRDIGWMLTPENRTRLWKMMT